MSINYKGYEIVQLIKTIIDNEAIKRLLKISHDHCEKEIKKASFITRVLHKKYYQSLKNNMERCMKEIADLGIEINTVTGKINDVGYASEDIQNIKEALSPRSDFRYNLEKDHPWVRLLNEQERDHLLVEMAAGRHGDFALLLNLSGYINSFDTSNEKLDFIHGFLPGVAAPDRISDAYRIGALFNEAQTSFGIDMSQSMLDYEPQLRHSLQFICLVNGLQHEETRRDMILDSLNETIGAAAPNEKLSDQLIKSEEKIASFRRQIIMFRSKEYLKERKIPAAGPEKKEIVNENTKQSDQNLIIPAKSCLRL